MKLGAIRKIRHNLDRGTTLLLYKSLVLPLIDYCDIVYGATFKDKLNKLQLLQNNACRTVLLADMDHHISDMHRELGLLSLYQQRGLHLCCQAHKSIYFNNMSSLSDFFVPVVEVTGRYTRYSDKCRMQVPKCRTKIGQWSFRYRGPSMWNYLPNELRSIECYKAFKRELSLRIKDLFENHPT